MSLQEMIEQHYGSCGLDAAAVVPFALLDDELPRLEAWLDAGFGGEMDYLARSRGYRHDLRRILPEVRSVVVTLTSYKRPARQVETQANLPRIAQFGWGDDYHGSIKAKLYTLLEAIRRTSGEPINGRVVVDSAPVLEKAWAAQAGLGWVGRHSLLIHPLLGSFTNIGLLLLDRAVGADYVRPVPVGDGCGTCRRCIEACPCGAVAANEALGRVIDARRCIAYYNTAANPVPVDADSHWIFGCDACQTACPHNSQAPEATHAPIREALLGLTREQWLGMSEEEFTHRTGGSTLGQTSLAKIREILG